MTTDKTETQKELLYRIDERTKQFEKDLEEVKSLINNNYITRAEFIPVRNIVYGLVGLILTAVTTALITLVVVGL